MIRKIEEAAVALERVQEANEYAASRPTGGSNPPQPEKMLLIR